jgi:hypothetical protein
MHVRPTDRIQVATTWILVALGTIAVALSLMTGAGVYQDGMHRAGLEAGERTRRSG